MSFDGGDHHPPFIDLNVHILVELVVGCVHDVMVDGDANTDIANKHLDFYRLLRYHQVLALQLGERDLHRFEQWGDHNAQDPPHWRQSLDWLLLLDVLQQLATVMEK
jgi:hypothetical protein